MLWCWNARVIFGAMILCSSMLLSGCTNSTSGGWKDAYNDSQAVAPTAMREFIGP